MWKFANRSPFGTSQRIAYGISSAPSPSPGGAESVPTFPAPAPGAAVTGGASSAAGAGLPAAGGASSAAAGARPASASVSVTSCSSWPISRNVAEPTRTVSPSDSAASVTRCPLTKVPWLLSRSTMRYSPATLRSSACWREAVGSETTMSFSGARPMRTVVADRGRAASARRPARACGAAVSRPG